MILRKNTNVLLIITFLVMFFNESDAQFPSKLIDFLPAPGQYTNAESIGSPEAAASIVGTSKGLVSLGAFGGTATYYFSQGIKNDPANPYGIDFTVFGNATLTWSEPGIIQVMKDENKNGIPDEIWYEIAGSDHFWNTTLSSYEVTYENSGATVATNIQWNDNQGMTGIIPYNSFHAQPYFPNATLFPGVNRFQYSLKGTRLKSSIDLSNPGVVNSYRRSFGYADNTPVLSFTEKLPDNPYTSEIEGSGGDAIDIDWAVNAEDKPIKLDEIHFVRIYTAMNDLAGWLGEISTEITGIRDVEPASVTGIQSRVVIQDISPKIKINEELSLHALVFEKGIRQDIPIVWTVSNSEIAQVTNGKLHALKQGKFKIRATSSTNSKVFFETELEVFTLGKAVISISSKSLKVNDRMELTGNLTDQAGNVIAGLKPKWSVDNQFIAEIQSLDGKYYLKGKKTGKCWLRLQAQELPDIRDSLQIEVFPETVLKKVYISVKTAEKTIFPRRSIWVNQVDLTSKVDHPVKTYGLKDISYVSLAHALAFAFSNKDFADDWAFRDDAEGGSALYLWKVPYSEDGSKVFTYGYGGSRSSAAYRKTWVVMLNQQPIVGGFDQIKVNNNDEILVYHLADNSIPWQVTQLTTGADSLRLNSTVEVQLRKYTCSLDLNRTLTVKSSEVIANYPVQVALNGQTKFNLIADEWGKTSFKAEKEGDYLVVSGIDVSQIVAGGTTQNKQLISSQLVCRIFPNPFSQIIRIETTLPLSGLQIFDGNGQQVFRAEKPASEIDLSALSSGIYLIRLKAGEEILEQKMVKN